MSKTVFVPKEIREGETRVAANVTSVKAIISKFEFDVLVESGAGEFAGISDEDYQNAGAKIVKNAKDGFVKADIIIAVNPREKLEGIKEGVIWLSTLIPQSEKESIDELKRRKVTSFSLNLLPRITRAQKMDSLSSQANIAGYKAVIMAADKLGKIFPLMMTPSGTIKPAKVVIMGVGVAGLQAIATAKRLGAQVEATDIRLATKEQVESLGAKFISVEGMEDLEQDENGYAVAPPQEFLDKQKAEIAKKVAEADVVITTALIPGRKAPILVTKEMVESMSSGAVIVDMATAMGGNCELTENGKTVDVDGVIIIGENNIPALVPVHSSDMYAKNIQNYLEELIKDGEVEINLENEVIAGCLLTKDGEVVNERVKEMLK